MGIILTILKILGIILLLLFGLLLVLAALLLLVPVRYGVQGSRKEGGRPRGQVRITWAFPALSITAVYEGKLVLCARVFGRCVWPRKRRRGTAKGPEGAQEGAPPGETRGDPAAPGGNGPDGNRPGRNDPGGNGPSGNRPDGNRSGGNGPGRTVPERIAPGETAEDRDQRTGGAGEERGPEGPGTGLPPGGTEGTGPDDPASFSSEPGILERAGRSFEAAASWLEAFAEDAEAAVERLSDRIGRLCAVLDHYRAILDSEDARGLVTKLRRIGGGIFRHIRPRRLEADLIFGSNDPSVTGSVLAFYSMFYPWLGEQVRLSPDLDRARLEGTFSMKGRVRLCVMLTALLRVVSDKRSWRLIKQLKKGGSD